MNDPIDIDAVISALTAGKGYGNTPTQAYTNAATVVRQLTMRATAAAAGQEAAEQLLAQATIDLVAARADTLRTRSTADAELTRYRVELEDVSRRLEAKTGMPARLPTVLEAAAEDADALAAWLRDVPTTPDRNDEPAQTAIDTLRQLGSLATELPR